MASTWRRAMVYLGLVDDEEYGEFDEYVEPSSAPERLPDHQDEPAAEPAERIPAVRKLSREQEPDHPTLEPRRSAVIRPMETAPSRVHVVEPQGFNDAQEVGDRLKADQPVIINLQGLSRDLQRRLIDFSSGLAYAVEGSMSRVADQVFLLAPADVEVSDEEKERLSARGLYRA